MPDDPVVDAATVDPSAGLVANPADPAEPAKPARQPVAALLPWGYGNLKANASRIHRESHRGAHLEIEAEFAPIFGSKKVYLRKHGGQTFISGHWGDLITDFEFPEVRGDGVKLGYLIEDAADHPQGSMSAVTSEEDRLNKRLAAIADKAAASGDEATAAAVRATMTREQ